MKIATKTVWKTTDGKLVPDGHKDAAFLFAGKGGQLPDHIVDQFDGADEFFDDVVVEHPEIHNHPSADMPEPGFSNIGKKQKEPEPPNNIPQLPEEPDPGFSNIGKKQKSGDRTSSVVKSEDVVPKADTEPTAGQSNVGKWPKTTSSKNKKSDKSDKD